MALKLKGLRSDIGANEMNRLFRHDRSIVINAIRANFAKRHDRLLAAIMLLAALAVVRSWFIDRPWIVAAWVAIATGIMIGLSAGRLVIERLAFHTSDGLLAAEALLPQTRQRFLAAWHGVGMALLALVTLIAKPSLLLVSVPAYLLGVLIAGLTHSVRMPVRIIDKAGSARRIRTWLHHPSAGFAAAVILLLSALPAPMLGTNALMAVVCIEAVLLTLMLTIVDDSIVRFMAIAGHGSQRIIVHHAKGLASFLAVAVPGCWIMLGPIAAGIVAAASVVMLLLQSLRILAYRMHGKRFADLLVSILAGLLVLIGYSMPLALPVVALAMLWWLQRRGRAKTWLLS